LFFAQLDREPGKHAVVWALAPEHLNELSIGTRGLVSLDEHPGHGVIDTTVWHPHWMAPTEDVRTIAATPISTNPRMTAQRAAFTHMGDSFSPLDEQFDGRLIREGALIRIDLPAPRVRLAPARIGFLTVDRDGWFPAKRT
jgi:hypothetical protein